MRSVHLLAFNGRKWRRVGGGDECFSATDAVECKETISLFNKSRFWREQYFRFDLLVFDSEQEVACAAAVAVAAPTILRDGTCIGIIRALERRIDTVCQAP